jgi:hypothetical protein
LNSFIFHVEFWFMNSLTLIHLLIMIELIWPFLRIPRYMKRAFVTILLILPFLPSWVHCFRWIFKLLIFIYDEQTK